MRQVKLLVIAIASFLFAIAGEGLVRRAIALSLCGLLSFNSLTCAATWGSGSHANAALPSSTHQVEQPSAPVSPEQTVAGICLFGVCAPVNLPKPVENLLQGGLDKAVQNQLRSLLADEIPISGSEHKFYESVANLPGGAFTPQRLPLNTLPPDTPIQPGDYEIPAHFYCTKIYSFDGRGNRFPLARLNGRMADVLAALYARASYDSSVSISDVQTLSWAIQSGMSYSELPDSQRALIDRLIPEYRDRMKTSFVDRLTGIVDNVSRISGNRLPGVNQLLSNLGSVGDVAGSLLRAREQVLRTNYSYQALAQAFAPQKDVFLEGGTEETPWSRVQENVYMRFIAPDGALNDGIVQVRIIGNEYTEVDNEYTEVDGSYLVAQVTIPRPSHPGVMIGQILLGLIVRSVGVPEATGHQAITAVAKSDSDEQPIFVIYSARMPTIAKNVSQAIASGKPDTLTRADSVTQANNRRLACPPNMPRPNGMTCDEYPFASTYQGGAGAHTMLVPAIENSKQGYDLMRFYLLNTIKVGDSYRVEVR